MQFRKRRRLAILITLAACGLFAAGHWMISNRLGHASYYSGGALLACVCILMLFGIRKRLPMLPLLTVSTWTQIHIYTGLFSLAVYGLHVPRLLANGLFEGALSILFLSVALSGLYGVYISRVAPRKMNAVPGEFRFDRFPWHRQRLAERASEVLDGLQVSLASPVLATFYRDRLQPFFSSPVPIGFLVLPNSWRRQRLLHGLRELDRYLSDQTQAAAGQLAALVRKRDELDFHYALQLRLRVWVALHAVLSTVLLGWCLVHVAMVLTFI